jgi:hypothetical protein
VYNSVSKEEVSPILNVARAPSVDWFAFCRMFLMATLSPKMVTTLAGERNKIGVLCTSQRLTTLFCAQ